MYLFISWSNKLNSHQHNLNHRDLVPLESNHLKHRILLSKLAKHIKQMYN